MLLVALELLRVSPWWRAPCGADPRVGEAIGLPDPPIVAILGIFAFRIAANICYTGGWVAELLVNKFRPCSNTTQPGIASLWLWLWPLILDLRHPLPGDPILDRFRHCSGKQTDARPGRWVTKLLQAGFDVCGEGTHAARRTPSLPPEYAVLRTATTPRQ